MASIFKRKKDRRNRNAPYLISYTNAGGERKTVTGCTDYAATQSIANKLETEVQLRRRGVVDEARERCAQHASVPVEQHVTAFIEFVKSKGRATRYVQQVQARLEAFLDYVHAERITDITAERVTSFILALRQKKLSGCTVNEYIGALKFFTKWATTVSRLPSNSLAVIAKLDSKAVTKTRPRRGMKPDEIGALLEATRRRPLLELMTVRTGANKGEPTAKVKPRTRAKAEALGRDRALAYLLALWTGLRRSELAALQWRDVHVDGLPANLTLRSETTKAKRADVVALHPQIAEALREHRPESRQPTDRVLGTVPGMKVLKADLKLAKIEFENEVGRVDLHSMRKSVNTYLAVHGVPQRIAQAHMRHKDPRLTAGPYTDEALLPVASSIAGLPWLPTAPNHDAETIVATGTDDTPVSTDDRRAAHAQRSCCPTMQDGALLCSDAETRGDVGDRGISAQEETDAQGCASVHDNSAKRVIGLEPTTSTLAT